MPSSQPATPSSAPKRPFVSFSVRRPSNSSANLASVQPRASSSSSSLCSAVAASPTSLKHNNPTSNANPGGGPASSGIPALRSLRNLLPFGPSKHSNNLPSTPYRNPFSGFGPTRRSFSVTREKEAESKLSFDSPVIAIDRPLSHLQEEPPLRRSFSLSRLDLDKPLPNPLDQGDSTANLQVDRQGVNSVVPILCTPSPGPPLTTELSTIIEADSSGISKHVPLLTPSTESARSLSPPSQENVEEHTMRRPLPSSATTLSTSPSPQISSTLLSASSFPIDSSVTTDADLELSTSELVSQVQDALAGNSWSGNDKAVVIDADTSFLSFDRQDVIGKGSPGSNSADVGPSDAVDDVKAGGLGSHPSFFASGSRSNSPLQAGNRKDQTTTSTSLQLDIPSSSGLRARQPYSAPPEPKSISFNSSISPSSAVHSSTSTTTVKSASQPTHNCPQTQTLRSTSADHLSLRMDASLSPSAQSSSRSLKPETSSSLPRWRSSVSNLSPQTPCFFAPGPSTQKVNAVNSKLSPTQPMGSHADNVNNDRRGMPTPESSDPTFAPQTFVYNLIHNPSDFEAGLTECEVIGNDEGLDVKDTLRPSAITSTPLKQKVNESADRQIRRSSLPVASWRQRDRDGSESLKYRKQERNSQERSTMEIWRESVGIGPEVRVLEPSPNFNCNNELDANGWSPRLTRTSMTKHDKQSPDSVPYSREVQTRNGSETDLLGSPFHTPSERERPEVTDVMNDGDTIKIPKPCASPSHSPSPSPVHLPARTSALNVMSTPSPPPWIPPESFVSSFKEWDGASTPTGISNFGSLSGRPSRRVPAPLRLLWNNGGTDAGEERIERQPSPLRSVVDAEDNINFRHNGRQLGTVTNARPSFESNSSPATLKQPYDPPSRQPADAVSRLLPDYDSLTSPGPAYHSHSRPPTRLRERDLLMARTRKRSLSVQENTTGILGSLSVGERSGGVSSTSAGLSAKDRLARARYGDIGNGGRPWSSMSMRRTEGVRTEWSNSKGVSKAFRAAGLLDYDREKNVGVIGIERSTSEKGLAKERTREREREVFSTSGERRGSVSALLGISTSGRHGLRCGSEYTSSTNNSNVNLSLSGHHRISQEPFARVRPYSRMAFSESGGSGGSAHGRRGSGSNYTLMDSPTFTVSTSASGSRDAPASTSTGATSVSTNAVFARDGQASTKEREREREELKELKEKHAVETGALLNALSDSQMTSRILREENGELRERVANIERENGRLRRVIVDLEREVERLKYPRDREGSRLLSRSSSPTRLAGVGSLKNLLALKPNTIPPENNHGVERQQEMNGEGMSTGIAHAYSNLDAAVFRAAENDSHFESPTGRWNNRNLEEHVEENSNAFRSTHQRRLSASSSIFPIPPSNMTMLLHEDNSIIRSSNRNSGDHFSLNGFTMTASPLSIQRTLKGESHSTTKSISSSMSFSPTENVSVMTGSPGSLFLKPEHEVLLGEMESLDLGRLNE